MKVYAHRGFSGKYPENTMLAFRKAYEAGAEGIELDIHESKDGKLVIIHDESLVRTTGVQAKVDDLTLAELTQINASKTQDDLFEAPIPSLEEYFDFIRTTDMITNIEIKTNLTWYPQIEHKAVDMVRSFHLEDKVIFSSFNWLSMARIKQFAPDMPCGLLYERMLAVRNLAFEAKDAQMQYLHPDFALLDDVVVSQCRQAGIELNVWTVNEPQKVRQLMAWNVLGVISNYPDMCLRELGQ